LEYRDNYQASYAKVNDRLASANTLRIFPTYQSRQPRAAQLIKAMILDPPDESDLLESTQQQQHPDFVKHLIGQEGPMREEGKAAIITFEDNAKPLVRKLRNSEVLGRYLNEPQPEGTICRRLFVLEGLPRNHLQVLGAKLKAPPSFFASHWAGLGNFMGYLLNRTPRHYDSQNRFLLIFPKFHQARIKALEGDDSYPFYFTDSSVPRPLSKLTIFGDLDGPLSSFEHISFWSRGNGESWDSKDHPDPPTRSTHLANKRNQ
jgi:hypothetical protein